MDDQIRIYSHLEDGEYGLGYPNGTLLFVLNIKNGQHVRVNFWFNFIEFIMRSGECGLSGDHEANYWLIKVS